MPKDQSSLIPTPPSIQEPYGWLWLIRALLAGNRKHSEEPVNLGTQ